MARKTVIRRKDIVISASVAVLIIAGVVLVQVMCIMPAFDVAALHEDKVDNSVKKLEDNSRKRRDVEQIEKQNAEFKTRLAIFDGRVPSKGEVAALFAEVLRSADQNDLKIFQTQPREMEVLGQGFYRFPYELNFQGDYHDVGRFLSEIESHASFMQVRRMELSGGRKPGIVRIKILLFLYGSAGAAGANEATSPS